MLSPPALLPDATVADVLRDEWGVAATEIAYRAVGFGSHHWEVRDAQLTRWFVTADDLAARRADDGESFDAVFERLRAALSTAMALQASGLDFVVAPLATRDHGPLARPNEQFAIALYPYVEGRSFAWGDFSTPGHRTAVVELLATLHGIPTARLALARRDDFAVPYRDQLLARGAVRDGGGPYTANVEALLARNAPAIHRFVARYDALVRDARSQRRERVITHGEPHPGNTMLSDGTWLLIDWDTALLAPPERDLWLVDPGDGSELAAYAAATGRTPAPVMLELYATRWTLTDLAADVHHLRGEHTRNADDEKYWRGVCSIVAALDEPA